MRTFVRDLNNQLEQVIHNKEAVSNESVGKKAVTSIQYYAAAMAVMFLLYNVSIGAKSIIEENRIQTLSRLRAAPVSNQAILMGKFLGTLFFSSIQLLILYFGTSTIFEVEWGENKWQIISLGLSYALAVSG